MPFLACLSALAVIIAWGVNFVVIKLGVSEIPPLALLASRFFIAGLLFIPFMKWPGWRKALMMIGVGFGMGVLHQGTLFVGLQIMPAGMMSILLQSQIIIATLIGWLFLKETIGWPTLTGIALGIAGIIILIGMPTADLPLAGYVYGLISAFFIAVTYVLMKSISTVHGPTYIALMSLPVSPIIALCSLIFEGTDWMGTLSTDVNWTILGGSLFYQSVLISITHIYWQRLMKEYPLSMVIPWTLLIPVFGVIAAMIVFKEPFTLPIFLGGLLTVAGVGIITLRKIQKGKAPQPALE